MINKPDQKKFITVSISVEDYELYDKIRQEIMADNESRTGVKQTIGMASVIKTGMTFWLQRRKFEVKK